MLIEEILPAAVADKSTLRDRLFAEANNRGLLKEEAEKIISVVPEPLINALAFLDKMTNLWRYEFGLPYNIGKSKFWGTHMWVPVSNLFNALRTASSRLSNKTTQDRYLERLADDEKHQDVLVEMIPGFKVDPSVNAYFEVEGKGIGNCTIDWFLGPYDGRKVLLEVKRRVKDFIEYAEKSDGMQVAPEPIHDPTFLFQSVEHKFKPADSNLQLQGVWIVTDIKQNEKQLLNAFYKLNQSKVHFAILGDWKDEAYVMTKQPEDEEYLRSMFHIAKSQQFTFT